MQILSVSRRTDIPAFYAPWFMNRIRDGYAFSVNPYNPKQVRRISLCPSEVAALVFWSKNPAPLIPHLDELQELGHRFYFQITLTGLGRNIEPAVPEAAPILSTMRELAAKLGPEKLLWRFDPICLHSDEDQDSLVLKDFDKLSRALEGATHRVAISFLDLQAQVRRRLASGGQGRLIDPARMPPQEAQRRLKEVVVPLREMASTRGMELVACAPKLDLTSFGVPSAPCIDGELIRRLFALDVGYRRDRYQRPSCQCQPSVDLGSYGSCPHGCLYCYGGCDSAIVRGRRHDPQSPYLLEPETLKNPAQGSLWRDNP